MKKKISNFKSDLEKHPLLLLISSLVRVNDLEDARIILDNLGHFERSIDIAICPELTQSLICILGAILPEN